MITFEDGPAKGEALTLARAPFLLRVVIDADGKLDGLDQLTDKPSATEAVHVYRRIGSAGTAHVDRRDPKTGRRTGHWMAFAKYRLARIQPDDHAARHTDAWQQWATANARNA